MCGAYDKKDKERSGAEVLCREPPRARREPDRQYLTPARLRRSHFLPVVLKPDSILNRRQRWLARERAEVYLAAGGWVGGICGVTPGRSRACLFCAMHPISARGGAGGRFDGRFRSVVQYALLASMRRGINGLSYEAALGVYTTGVRQLPGCQAADIICPGVQFVVRA